MTALAVTTLVFSSTAEALTQIGNYSSTNDGVDAPIGGDNEQTAVGFTLPVGNNYTLDSIRLRLDSYNTGLDTALIQIYRDAAKTTTSPNGAILESVLFTNPVSSL